MIDLNDSRRPLHLPDELVTEREMGWCEYYLIQTQALVIKSSPKKICLKVQARKGYYRQAFLQY